MSNERKVLVYGASGYTGKLVSESLAQRNIPFYMAGRTQSRLEEALKIVEQRHGAPVDAEIVVASNSPEELRPLFDQVDVVINVSGQASWSSDGAYPRGGGWRHNRKNTGFGSRRSGRFRPTSETERWIGRSAPYEQHRSADNPR